MTIVNVLRSQSLFAEASSLRFHREVSDLDRSEMAAGCALTLTDVAIIESGQRDTAPTGYYVTWLDHIFAFTLLAVFGLVSR